MKVSVRNLGVIKEKANFELKPLTVLIGPNNAGKTWLAYSLAGVLGPFGSGQYALAYADKKVPNTYEPLDTAIEHVLAEGNATIDLRQFAEEYGEKYFNDVAHYARNWMPSFLSTRLAHFDDLDISLNLAETKADFLKQVSDYSPTSDDAGSVLTIRKNQGDDKVIVKVQDAEGQEEPLDERIPPEEVRKHLVDFVATALRQSLYSEIRIFPTERTALVTARFAGRTDRVQPRITERAREALEVLAKEVDMRELAEQSLGAREVIWPVNSFMDMLNTIVKNTITLPKSSFMRQEENWAMICVRKTVEKRAFRASDWPCFTGISSDLAHVPVFSRLHTRFSQILALLNRGDVFLRERCSTGPVEPHEVAQVSEVRWLKQRRCVLARACAQGW